MLQFQADLCKIGHLEGAAGVASVIKCVMMLETGTIPPNIHFDTPNPAIRFDEWNMKIPTRIMSWPTNGIRRISINSFGYGGSNAHAILDDAYSYLHQRRLDGHHFTMVPKLIGERRLNETAQTLLDQSHPPIHRLFAISAQDKDGIGRVTNTLASFLKKKASQLEIARETDYLSDLAFTLHERRSHLQWKTFCIASSLYELQDMLTSKESTRPEYMSSRKPRLGFVFTGQGAQWANMGIELLKYGAFRDSITAADKYLQQDLNCGWSATEELAKGESTSNIKAALYSQALCTVLQVALVDLLKEWDIVPVAVVGHSSGEIAAAYCLGVLSREDAWKVAYFRGLLSSQLRDMGLEGGMMACGASPGDVTEMISQFAPNDVHIACINSPQSVTVSGDIRGIESLHEALQAKGVFVRKLLVDTAYHSNHMQLVAQEYFEAIADISANSPTGDCNMYSSVSGCVVQPGELGAAYWVRNLISPVQFASAIQHLVHTLELPDFDRTNEKEVDILVEIGPHSALQVPVTESLQAIGLTDVPYYSVLKRHQSAIETALNLAGTLFAAGYLPNFLGINQLARESRTLVDLPPYPWNHSQSHWAESRMAKEYRLREPSQSSLLGTPSPSLVAGERVWRGHIRLSKDPWIADHKIQGLILYPAAGFITMAIEAVSANAETTRKVKRLSLRDIHLISALITPEDSDIEYSVSLRPYLAAARETSYTWTEFTVASSRDGNPFERNCTGLIMIEYDSSNCDEILLMEEALMVRYREATELCRTAIKLDEFYRALAAVGLQYGPDFRNLVDVMIGLNQSCCTLDIPNIGLGTPQRLHVIHPRTLDAVFHMAFAALIGSSGSITRAMVPKFIHKVVISADIPYGAGVHLRGVANVERHGFDEILADIFVVGAPKSHPVLQVSGLCFAEVVGDSNGNNLRKVPRSICSKLVWRPAINLLRPEEQKGVILTAITALQRRDKTQLKDSAISIAAVLSVVT